MVAVASLSAAAMGCAAPEEELTGDSAQNATAAPSAEKTVRAYYAATKASKPAEALAPIVDDDAILSAPSIQILKGVGQVEGKKAFIDAVDGGSFLISKADIRDVLVKGDLVVVRIDLPLPNHDFITQIEFFTLKNGKIARLDSYYDGIRFTKALPAIALERLKSAFGM